MTQRIYLDNHATTPCDPRVAEAMVPYLTEMFGNASSRSHAFGWEAEEGVEQGRQCIARVIGAQAREIIFLSGATEANNLAMKGVVMANNFRGHVITAATEHSSVLGCCKRLQSLGVEVTVLPVDGYGQVDPQRLEDSIRKDTLLISIMAANNEVGTVANLRAIGEIAGKYGVPFHTDAAQAFGKVPIDVQAMNISLLSLTGHKIYGPKGVGALYVRSRDARLQLQPIIDGGGQERGLRSGTLNVPGIVGLGKASEIYAEEWKQEAERLSNLRERMWTGLQERFDGAFVNGHPTARLPGNLNVCLPTVEAQPLLMWLGKEVAFSTGSACASTKSEASHVLKAIGLSDELAHASVRFGLGRFNTEEEIDAVLDRLSEAAKQFTKPSSTSKRGRAEAVPTPSLNE